MRVVVISAFSLTEDFQSHNGFNARYSSVLRGLCASFETSLLILERTDATSESGVNTYGIESGFQASLTRKGRRFLNIVAPKYFRPVWANGVADVLDKIEPSLVFVTQPYFLEIAAWIATRYPTVVFVEENGQQIRGLKDIARSVSSKFWWSDQILGVGSPMAPRGLAACEAVAVTSEREESWAARFMKPVFVVPHAVNLLYWQAPAQETLVGGWPPNTFFAIGSFGLMDSSQGLVEIVQALEQRYPGHGITIICASSRPYHPCMANLGSTVRLEGPIEDPRPYYQRALATLVPSFSVKGSKTTVLQGWAIGCPVVTTEAGSRSVGGRHGADLLAGSNPRDVADLMVRLTRDSDLRDRLVVGGLDRIHEEHTDEVVARVLARIVNSVVSD